MFGQISSELKKTLKQRAVMFIMFPNYRGKHNVSDACMNIFFIANGLSLCLSRILTNEPPHDKTNKMACAPIDDSDHSGHPPSLISLRCPHKESLGP